jgi:hypothetical protein
MIGLGTAFGARLVLPDAVSDYVVGAIAVITLWVGTSTLHWMDGMANHRLGVAGEELTADQLRKLRRRGWRVINHVMLEKGDIDHALLGPGGFFAVDSKYRTDWATSAGKLDELARKSHRQARALQSRLQMRTPEVHPAVVLWGPGRSAVFDDVFEHDGVLFCLGQSLVAHALELEEVIDGSTIDEAFAKLDEYVAKRDIGEALEHGERARPIGDQVQDLLIATFLAAVTFLTLTTAIKIPPLGVWSVVVAIAIATVSRSVRRRFPKSERVQRATTAVSATSIGFGGLLFVVVVTNLIL